ncbi:MAG: primosomal protein N' [Acidiferrobacterales bacterium]
MPAHEKILKIAIPAPLRTTFDYLPPSNHAKIAIGSRVLAPFGRRQPVGVVVGYADTSDIASTKLKRIISVLDAEALLPGRMLQLLEWTAAYYHHPIGEAIQTALPVLLRRNRPAEVKKKLSWTLTDMGGEIVITKLKRAPLQARLVEALGNNGSMEASELDEISTGWRAAMRQLEQKGLVTVSSCEEKPTITAERDTPPTLNAAQQIAIETIQSSGEGFSCSLLHGVTGSGKTEVYLRLVQPVLDAGKQALVLVPEIGLTPQLIERFRRRFPVLIVTLHSGLSNSERLAAWLHAREGRAKIVLGTRSAVFTPFSSLGLIVVDEEHDGSFKQQDGMRYHARDVAIMRASRESIPIVLGSATPSLESLKQATEGRYQLVELPERTRDANLPDIELLDMKRLAVNDGLSHPLVQAIRARLVKKEQSLLFLNRRGFSPVLMCYDCGWVAPCHRCDARLTLHRGSGRLRCHHCGADQMKPTTCPECKSENLQPLGEGTERIEQALTHLFPEANIVRIDRDTTRRKGSLEQKLNSVHSGEADILVGTQMLAKGHDFPDVTLVGIVNADQGLYSYNFRASELMLQQVMQVSGRAGRADKPGQVLIQTWHPDNPVFLALSEHDFSGFAKQELAARKAAAYPPYSYFAMLRAEATAAGEALNLLRKAESLGRAIAASGVEVLSPVPSPMERRAGRYRAQLLVQCNSRPPLHQFLNQWLDLIEKEKQAKRVRWSLDVDPVDMY